MTSNLQMNPTNLVNCNNNLPPSNMPFMPSLPLNSPSMPVNPINNNYLNIAMVKTLGKTYTEKITKIYENLLNNQINYATANNQLNDVFKPYIKYVDIKSPNTIILTTNLYNLPVLVISISYNVISHMNGGLIYNITFVPSTNNSYIVMTHKKGALLSMKKNPVHMINDSVEFVNYV